MQFSTRYRDDCRRQFKAEIDNFQGALFAIPDWTRRVLSSTVMSNGAASLDVSGVPSWMVPGISLLFRHNGRNEMYTLDSVADPVLTMLETNTGADWPIGTRIYLGLPARLPKQISGEERLRNGWRSEIEFQVEPGRDEFVEAAPAALTFQGHEVWLKQPTRVQTPVYREQSGIEQTDYGVGRTETFERVTYHTSTLECVFSGCDVDSSLAIEEMFIRQRGRRGEFYMPTWTQDIVPASTIAAGAAAIGVSGDWIQRYEASTTHKAIFIHFADGSHEFNSVTNITPAGSDSTLTLASPTANEIDPATIRRISWMPLRRFATDILTGEWVLKRRHARFTTAIQTLEDLAAE